ncbi:MAG: D-alanyl-D-alanine carboxypeptidase/D-alanyl-D-alanine-endopeptidase, partial [Actinomycetota bacterium]|nr:D-alanyl-D-alanine carboxypeptidase/D-alanyl-D-alanine-endopeptidase [Actinomycetota bacterium]
PTLSLPPASNNKLITAVAALDQLGPNARLQTELVAASGMVNGEVHGDAYLVGGGDPVLGTADYADHFQERSRVATSLESFADRLTKAGLKQITGRLLGDESRYDALRAVSSWPARFSTQNESGPLSALSVNDDYAAFPATQAEGASISGTRATDPPSFAAQTLGDLLVARGVRVEGGYGAGTAPKGTKRVGAIDSPPMRSLVQELLTESDNQTAELLTKELGHVKGRAGSTAAGVAVLNGVLRRLGLPLAGVAVTDGSGLDDGDRASCPFLAALLVHAGRHSPVGDGLPVAGRSGTLANRFVTGPARGRLRAKTGTLNDVTALSGFVDTQPGATLTFSYIASGRTVTTALVRIQEDLGNALVRYPEGPPLAALGPSS